MSATYLPPDHDLVTTVRLNRLIEENRALDQRRENEKQDDAIEQVIELLFSMGEGWMNEIHEVFAHGSACSRFLTPQRHRRLVDARAAYELAQRAKTARLAS